jgi:hypothetical protein
MPSSPSHCEGTSLDARSDFSRRPDQNYSDGNKLSAHYSNTASAWRRMVEAGDAAARFDDLLHLGPIWMVQIWPVEMTEGVSKIGQMSRR